MKRLLCLALAASLSACALTPASAPASGVIAKADTIILTGERGFAVAELAYITAADGVGRLADKGIIRGDTAKDVRRWNAEARAALVRGKATSDATEKARNAAVLFSTVDKLNLLEWRN